jgi:uncharacterized protein with PIN domain
MKLLLDEMLKSTANLLRIFGVDTEYFHPHGDSELMDKAKEEKRVLVTRDVELSKRCKAKKIKCLLIESVGPEEQLKQIISELKIELPFPEHTRCSICNVELNQITKEEAATHVPSDVLLLPSKFWLCPNCNKAYWEGSHWKNITYLFNKITGKQES